MEVPRNASVVDPSGNEEGAPAATFDHWREFFANQPETQSLRDVILASWARSAARGLERDEPVSFRRVSEEQLAEALNENRNLLEVSKPHLDWISSYLSGIDHVAYLTDRHGVILYSVGIGMQADALHLGPGYDWSEPTMGTNGAGTAISADCPVAVVGSEHFRTAFEDCTCTGAPVHCDGRVVGAIDVSTSVKDATPDRLALIAHVAFVIDRELALRAEAQQQELYRRLADSLRKREQELLRINAQLEALLDNTTAVIYLVDRDARLLRINRRWEALFGMSNDACSGRSLFEFFPSDTAERFVANNRRVFEARRAMEFEEHATVDGKPRTYLSVKVPICDETGEPYAVCGISTDITERLATELRERRVLQQESARKERFVTALAHELRTPISAISAAAELIVCRPGERERVEAAGQVVKRQTTHIAELLDKLLDAARVAHGPARVQKSHVNLSGVLEQALEAVRPTLASKRQALDVRLPPEPLVVQGDRTRLAQVFLNLLENASRYSNPGKPIRLHARCMSKEAVVSVHDEGCGIDPEVLPRVFDLLFQADERSGKGLGLGLSLVLRILQAHGGTVTAHSDGVGRGSEFVVRLPLAPSVTA